MLKSSGGGGGLGVLARAYRLDLDIFKILPPSSSVRIRSRQRRRRREFLPSRVAHSASSSNSPATKTNGARRPADELARAINPHLQHGRPHSMPATAMGSRPLKLRQSTISYSGLMRASRRLTQTQRHFTPLAFGLLPLHHRQGSRPQRRQVVVDAQRGWQRFRAAQNDAKKVWFCITGRTNRLATLSSWRSLSRCFSLRTARAALLRLRLQVSRGRRHGTVP